MTGESQSTVAPLACDVLADRADEALGASCFLGALSRVFAQHPVQSDIDVLAEIASLLGAEGLGEFEAESLAEHFDERFYVPCSARYVPLTESCLRRAQNDDGMWRFGSRESAWRSHALRCYAAAGYEWRGVAGNAPERAIEPDSLAVELAFLSYLAGHEAVAARRGDATGADMARSLFTAFAREHLSQWLPKAAECLAASEDDFFARATHLADAAVQAMGDA